MKTSLQHLTACRQTQLREIAGLIKALILPEKIILFGSFASPRNWEPYADTYLPVLPVGYEILVVTRSNDFRPDHSLQDLVEHKCRSGTPTNILVHDIGYVNEQLTQGQPFFFEICRDGILFFDSGAAPLAEPVMPDFPQVRDLAQRDFECWYHRSRVFYDLALHTRLQKEGPLTLFNLHQAAEQTYQAILLAFTGFKPCTHNLDKLRRYTNRFSLELAALFSRNGRHEDHLFKMLMSGYVDGRYKEGILIEEQELNTLVHRICSLLKLANRLCNNRILHLTKLAADANFQGVA